MDVITDKKKLMYMVEESAKGIVALPQFQRNFVWSRDAIADLLTSLLRGYYIGSFLLLRSDPESQPFAVRPILGANVASDKIRPDWLILDGQQRLTSLHYAFTAPDEPVRYTKHAYRFFIHLDHLLDGNDDELVESVRFDQCSEWEEKTVQFQQRILPLKEIPTWNRWKDAYEDWLDDSGNDDLKNTYRNKWREPWRKAIGQNLLEVDIPYIEIPKIKEGDEDGIADVCVIFEKLNSTGEPLSVYDLLTARLYKHNIDLHALWAEAVSQHQILNELSDEKPDTYGVLLLRTIALIRKKECKGKTLINLPPTDFEDDWRAAAEAMEEALKRLMSTQEGGFGVIDPKWMTYSTMLPVLAVALKVAKDSKAGPEAYTDIHAWYWGSVFSERYTGSVESTSYRDAMDLVQRIENPSFEPVCYRVFRERILENPNFTFMDEHRRNGQYRGIMNLIALQGARDFGSEDSIEFHKLDDHHIFPTAYLRDFHDLKGGEKVNTIVNKTLIVDTTNRSISRKSPKDYLESVLPAGHKEKILRSHMINAEAQSAMETNNYNDFVEARNKVLVNRVRELVGVAAATGEAGDC